MGRAARTQFHREFAHRARAILDRRTAALGRPRRDGYRPAADHSLPDASGGRLRHAGHGYRRNLDQIGTDRDQFGTDLIIKT